MGKIVTNNANVSQEAITITTIGQRLKSWRSHSMLKLVRLSKKVHISQGSLSDLENGKSLPSAKTLANLCIFSDINISWLLTGRGSMIRQESVNGNENIFPDEYAGMTQDPELKKLINRVIRVYRRGDVGKRAHLEGFLVGVDIDTP